MELQIEKINKTIVINESDIYLLIKHCKEGEAVSREFYDWYLDDSPKFFSTTGMMVIEGGRLEGKKMACSFDFSDPDEVEFILYNYYDQKIIARYFFYRQENLTMNEIDIEVEYISIKSFKNQGNYFTTESWKKRFDTLTQKLLNAEKQKIKRNDNKGNFKKIKEHILNEAMKLIAIDTFKALTYEIYALMYYVYKKEPQEITTEYQKQIEGETIKIKSFYKYSGYVDLRESKIYKPKIEKSPDEPIREYQRHIEKWTVRGHYRNIRGKKVWVEPHLKGQGELEKRIYSTEDEKDLNLIPKIFEVERTVRVNTEAKEPHIIKHQISEELRPIKKTILQTIKKFILGIFHKKAQ